MNIRYLILLIVVFGGYCTNAQTDFPALKQQFLDYRKADKQDSALLIARKMNQQALLEQSDTSYWYALSLRYQGNPHDTWGNYDSTIHYWSKSVELFKNYHPENTDYAASLNSLGVLYSDIGDYKSSEMYLMQALAIRRKNMGEENLDLQILNNLGVLYSDIGDYKASEQLFKQAIEIYKKSFGEEHQITVGSLINLGVLYKKMGDYKTAESLYKKGTEIYKKTLGEEHPFYAVYLFDLGILYSSMGDYNSAVKYLIASNSVKTNNISTNFSWLSAKEKEAYWIQENEFYSYLNSFASEVLMEVPSSTELSYNGNLVSKSLLLETSRELDQALASSSDTTLKENYRSLKLLKKNYSKLVSEGTDNKELIERLNREADSLDKILVNSLGEYAASKRKFEITWKDVQSNLTTSDAAIEFARYYDNKDSLYKYMALVVRPDYEYPQIALLGEEQEISNLIHSKNFSSLYPLVWDPIEEHLNGVERIYYSPTGQLNNVSFSALCFGKEFDTTLVASKEHNENRGITIESVSSQACDSYLMDKYELHQLTTTRYLADGTLEKERKMNTGIALSGGINYDAIPVSNSTDKDEDNDEYLLAQNLSKQNEDRSSSNISMGCLQGTKEEVEQIGELVASKSWRVSTYTEKGAEEGKVKEALEAEQLGIIHIATHGFAFPDFEQNKKQAFMGMEETSYRASEDPMVRCGLMLSGSNVSWTGNPQKMVEETGEDGILTAAEISNLDLSKTKLVVLSACETGLGKIEGSEGTFGLKRGFKLAGVEQIIVSLWSVPDKETMELMTLFYKDLSESLDPVKSFEKAQKIMRNKYPTRPDLWAGFVLVR